MVMLAPPEETSRLTLANNEEEFVELYNYYFPQVYKYVHYHIDDFHDADDLISFIFEKTFKFARYYQADKAPFSAWLFSISRNTLVDYYRHRHVAHIITLDKAPEPIDCECDPAKIVAFNETKQQLQRALGFLTERERDIIAMKFWNDSSNKEISRLTGVSESNTGVILCRAIKRLRMILEELEKNKRDQKNDINKKFNK